jgi:hypothetical protein
MKVKHDLPKRFAAVAEVGKESRNLGLLSFLAGLFTFVYG